MIGAIIGDTVGSVYEFTNTRDYNFPMLLPQCEYTDDSVLTFAIAYWQLTFGGDELTAHRLEKCLVDFVSRYPNPMGSYGEGFTCWVHNENRQPYNSWGNGSAMRVSSVGWMYDTLQETERVAELSASVTHNHPEGIKGAQATAAAIWMARNGKSKKEIRDYIEERFGYDLHRTWEELHYTYRWEASCQKTVPEAIIAFLDSTDFEDALRKAVSMGGDSDTLACICAAISEAYYRVIPDKILSTVLSKLPTEFLGILDMMCDMTVYGEFRKHDIRYIRDKNTPDRVESLERNQVFVFGSNISGLHGGGAARLAYERFGAEWGVGVGPTGQCYAIPTMQGGVETIKPYVDEFIAYAENHPEQIFLVTRIGCGIAGFSVAEIAPLFKEAIKLENVKLPEDFWKILK